MSDEPINVDPPTPEELANASNKLGDPQLIPTVEPSRAERALVLRNQLARAVETARGFLDANDLKKAFTAIDRARTLEDQALTLERFKDDEEHRLWLIRQAENGYH